MIIVRVFWVAKWKSLLCCGWGVNATLVKINDLNQSKRFLHTITIDLVWKRYLLAKFVFSPMTQHTKSHICYVSSLSIIYDTNRKGLTGMAGIACLSSEWDTATHMQSRITPLIFNRDFIKIYRA